MSWHQTDPVNERLKFVAAAQSGHIPMTELCRRFGISRKTGSPDTSSSIGTSPRDWLLSGVQQALAVGPAPYGLLVGRSENPATQEVGGT